MELLNLDDSPDSYCRGWDAYCKGVVVSAADLEIDADSCREGWKPRVSKTT